MNIENQVILVTGGAGAIGRFLVSRLAETSSHIIALDKDEHGLADLQSGLANVTTRVCDITCMDTVGKTINDIYEAGPAPSVLINNAGLIHSEPFISMLSRDDMKHGIDTWHRTIDVNLHGLFYVTLCVAEQLVRTRSKGLIVNISSIAAHGNAGQSAYSAAKAAVNALTVTWSKELSPFGIRSTAIAPGFIDVASTGASLKDTKLEEWRKKTPLRRLGQLDEVLQAIRFIVQNDYYNGRVLELDGGLRL